MYSDIFVKNKKKKKKNKKDELYKKKLTEDSKVGVYRTAGKAFREFPKLKKMPKAKLKKKKKLKTKY